MMSLGTFQEDGTVRTQGQEEPEALTKCNLAELCLKIWTQYFRGGRRSRLTHDFAGDWVHRQYLPPLTMIPRSIWNTGFIHQASYLVLIISLVSLLSFSKGN